MGYAKRIYDKKPPNHLIGQTFGKLFVLEVRSTRNDNGVHFWKLFCRCSCGNEKEISTRPLQRGITKSCGCDFAKPPNHLIGKVFSKLTILSLRHFKLKSGLWTYKALCRCECGKEKEIDIVSLKGGRTGSCGCNKDRYLKTTGNKNPSFKGYEEIRAHFWTGYKTGADDRGYPFEITMEYAWSIFESQGKKCALSGVPLVFGSNAKNSNTTASIDRIDVTKGYVEGNIQWVHKRLNVMRNVLSIADFVDWCRKVANHADNVSGG